VAHNQPAEPSLSRIGLLVVDDERAIVEMLKIGLELQGFSVWPAADAQEALDLFRQYAHEIHLALLDVQMPGVDGPTLLSALRTIASGLTCCFMSGSTDPYTEQDLLDRGAIRVFRKPFSMVEVSTFLRQAMGLSEQRSSLRLVALPTEVTVGGQKGQVRNRSVGGLGLWSAAPLAVGSVLRLQFEEKQDAERSIEVRHCRQAEQGWLIGCRFVG